MRIIKKYSNRRLYDTEVKRYITLVDLKALVVDQVAVKVIDAKTEADLTCATLLQIILEQEESQIPFFTVEVLQNIIRFYGAAEQSTLKPLFDQYLQQLQGMVQSGVASEGFSFWQQMQNQLYTTVMGAVPKEKK